MTKAKNLARLGQVAQLILDVKLAALQKAAKKRQHSLDLLNDLNRATSVADLPLFVAYEADLRYQNWADKRRAEINYNLARQTADMLAARDDAGQAFGKYQSLRGLQNTQR